VRLPAGGTGDEQRDQQRAHQTLDPVHAANTIRVPRPPPDRGDPSHTGASIPGEPQVDSRA
jgi:hypothetical protein